MASIARIVFGALALALVAVNAAADEFPSRVVRIIAPMAAGGSVDTAARLIADALARQLAQTVIVENRTGAGGIIGIEAAVRAPADGYTLVIVSAASWSILPRMKKVGYDTARDFAPLGQIWSASQALVVSASSDMKTVADLVAKAKANPGKLSFSSAGNGTLTHLGILLLSHETGIKVVHVPYHLTSQGVTGILGGQIDAAFGDVSVLAPYVESGKLTALAVAAPQRSTLLPKTPTTAEAGLPGVKIMSWFGLFALARTPPPALERLKSAMRSAQVDPAYVAALAKIGNSTGTVGAEAFAEMIQQEDRRLAPIVRASGIRFD